MYSNIIRILTSMSVWLLWPFMLWASAADEETLALSQSSFDRFNQPNLLEIGLISVLILAMIGLVFISTWNFGPFSGRSFGQDLAASNLFLGVYFEQIAPKGRTPGGQELGAVAARANQSAQDGVTGLAYLRELGLKEALLVAPTRLVKNDEVLLHLDSLPNFPQQASEITGVVKESKSIGGDPENFLVRVRFHDAAPAASYGLINYLKLLSSSGRSHAH